MVLLKNWPFFYLFFLGNIGQENVFYDILEGKNDFLGNKDKKIKKSKNCPFSKGVNPQFWSKNGHFSNSFFLGNIGQENAFYDILKRKKAFVGYKNDKIKKSKNWHFSKSLTHGFGPKIPTISTFFRKYRPGKCLLRYSKTKKGLSRVKKKTCSKSRKNWHFSKGVSSWFSSKYGHFFNFFFQAI